MKKIHSIFGVHLITLAAVAMFWAVPVVLAETTTPLKIVYNGHLLDSAGDAYTSQVNVRFSWWTSADYDSSDTTATGAINTSASNYASWNEVHTVTPNSNGYFSLEMGSGTALPDLSSYSTSDLISLHLQIEVKAASAANTDYEMLDRDSSNAAVDRAPLLSVPFALNANLLDKRAVGTASGSIPLLETGGMLNVARVPGGTNRNFFTIDSDGDGSTITLKFGESLGKTITWDNDNTWFNFNDDVRIQGNLTVTGLINGVDITSLSSDNDSHLKASSGGGLNMTLAAGDYRLRGTVTQFAGTSSIAMTDNSTNYLFFTSTGLIVAGGGFPTDKAYIPVAEVVAAGGAVTNISDRRVFNSDDRESTREIVFHPEYAGAAYEPDGTSNIGQLYVSYSGANLTNYYVWKSTQSSLNDYDIVVKTRLSSHFVRWATESPVVVEYKSDSADSADNKLDITFYDTSGTQVTLSGSTTSLASTSWGTTNIEFGGNPTWTAGQDVVMVLKLSSKDNNKMNTGYVKFKYVVVPSE